MELFIPNRSDIMHQIFGYLVSKQNVYTNYLTSAVELLVTNRSDIYI